MLLKYFYFFVELKKFKRYQMVMTSYNIIGESPPSTPVEVSVGEAGRWKQKETDHNFNVRSTHLVYGRLHNVYIRIVGYAARKKVSLLNVVFKVLLSPVSHI